MPFLPFASSSQTPSWSSQFFGGPSQFVRIPMSSVLVARIAGVHSTVWILAMRAETTSRAVW